MTTPAAESGAKNVARVALRALRLAVVALVGWSLLAWAAARGLVVEAKLARADALVVLAGSSTYLERTEHAARLFAEGRAPLVLLTNDGLIGGWSNAENRNPLFVERAAEDLRRRAVPAANVEIIPQVVSSTYEEAVGLREYAASRGLRSLLVVTSAYHSRRALWTLRRVFRDSGIVIGLDAPDAGAQSPAAVSWWLHPLGWQMVPGEYLKLIYYAWSYR